MIHLDGCLWKLLWQSVLTLSISPLLVERDIHKRGILGDGEGGSGDEEKRYGEDKMKYQEIIDAVDKTILEVCNEFKSHPTRLYTENDIVCCFYGKGRYI